jgi:hypothetical protein
MKWKFSDYQIKMPNLEYNARVSRNVATERFTIARDVLTWPNHFSTSWITRNVTGCHSNHPGAEETIWKSTKYCKDCNFETDLMVILKQHFREYHRKDTDCVQDQPKNDAVVKNYICQKCSFETDSVLLWIKHLGSWFLNTEEECENVRTVSCSGEEWYRCECCSFKTVLERHQAANHSLHQKKIFRCFHCKYKRKTKNYLREQVNYKHSWSWILISL